MLKNLFLLRKVGVYQILAKPIWSPSYYSLPAALLRTRASAADPVGKSQEVVDINVEDMAKSDTDFARNFTTTVLSVPKANEAEAAEAEEDDVDPDEAEADSTPLAKTADEAVSVRDMNGIPLAPIDINPWAEDDEDESKVGTVEAETIDIGDERDDEYPPIPETRAGEYKFKGIKLKLPPNLMHNGTYRYRLDKDEQDLADDIRVCCFEK